MLKKYKNIKILKSCMLSKKDFLPIPTYACRNTWTGLDKEIKEYIKAYVVTLENYKYNSLAPTSYLRFFEDGNREVYQDEYYEKRRVLFHLMIAELIEGNKKYLNLIIDGIWNICEESSWVIPAHRNHKNYKQVNKLPDITQNDFIDLFSAETGSLLSWVYYFFKEEMEEISPLINKRILYELNRRIVTPYIQIDDMPWMGFVEGMVNNWNPWIVSNCLLVGMLVEDNEERRIEIALRSMDILEKFIEVYEKRGDDGGCDEGVSYWNAAGACLFDALEILYKVTNETVNIYEEKLIINMGEYIAKMYIGNQKYVNFADGSIYAPLSYDQIYRYGKRVQSKYLINFAEKMKENTKVPQISRNVFFVYRTLEDLLVFTKGKKRKFKIPDKQEVWFQDIEVFCARETDEEGFFVAAKGGNNGESHNHNDIGNYIIYCNEEPLIIDVGVETYTAKTFGSERYDIWTMQSQYHNLPIINGCNQLPGKQYNAESSKSWFDDTKAKFDLDISKAYGKEACIEQFTRTIILDREKKMIEILDQIKSTHGESNITFNMMTLDEPKIVKDGILYLSNRSYSKCIIEYDDNFKVDYEVIHLRDDKLIKEWGTHQLYRIKFNITKTNKNSFLFIVKRA